eukprot:5940373-Prymnesium_polylepis.1
MSQGLKRWLESGTHTSIMQFAVVGRTYAASDRNRVNIREYPHIFANIRKLFAWVLGQYSRIIGTNTYSSNIGTCNVHGCDDVQPVGTSLVVGIARGCPNNLLSSL